MSNSRIERMLSGRTDNLKQVKEMIEGDYFNCECGAIGPISTGQYIFPGVKEEYFVTTSGTGVNQIVCKSCYTKKWNAYRKQLKEGIEAEAKAAEIKNGN